MRQILLKGTLLSIAVRALSHSSHHNQHAQLKLIRMGQQGQLATYKEMAAAAEEDRGRLEAEVVATAQLATAVEARLRGALAARDAAEARVAASELRAHQACILHPSC